MSIPGFDRAQRQWENMTPYDNECRQCEDDLYQCGFCGTVQETCEQCPDCGSPEVVLMDDVDKHELHAEPDEPEYDPYDD